jgi:hypothetical protein
VQHLQSSRNRPTLALPCRAVSQHFLAPPPHSPVTPGCAAQPQLTAAGNAGLGVKCERLFKRYLTRSSRHRPPQRRAAGLSIRPRLDIFVKCHFTRGG